MRILLVGDYSSLRGGAELAVYALRTELRARGHDARWFASSAALPGEKQHADYICKGTLGRWRALLQTINVDAFFALRRVLKEFEPDCVLVTVFLTQLSPLILPVLRPYRTVYYSLWYRAVCAKGTLCLPSGDTCREPWGIACLRNRCLSPWDWVALEMQRRMLRRWSGSLRRTVANGGKQASLLNERQWPVSAVVTPPSLVTPEPLARCSTPLVLFAARLSPEKGAALLLEALARVLASVPDASLRIVGDGPQKPELEALAGRLGISRAVSFIGQVWHAGLVRHLSQAWVVAVPSIWREPFGMIALDSQMSGAPVVISETAGAAESVVHGETGFIVPPGDVDALAAALGKLLSDRSLVEAMGAKARALASERSSVSRFADAILAQVDHV